MLKAQDDRGHSSLDSACVHSCMHLHTHVSLYTHIYTNEESTITLDRTSKNSNH